MIFLFFYFWLSNQPKIIDLIHNRFLQYSEETRIKAYAHKREVTCLLQFPRVPSIKVWNFADLSDLQYIKCGHVDRILTLSINEHEPLLASGSQDSPMKLRPISPVSI